jgi:hypothetical protein
MKGWLKASMKEFGVERTIRGRAVKWTAEFLFEK